MTGQPTLHDDKTAIVVLGPYRPYKPPRAGTTVKPTASISIPVERSQSETPVFDLLHAEWPLERLAMPLWTGEATCTGPSRPALRTDEPSER